MTRSRNSIFTIPSAVVCLFALWISPIRAAADAVPDSLTNAGEFAENIYDHARDGDWPAAAKKLAALRAALLQVKTDLAKPTADQQKQLAALEPQMAVVEKAITAKQKQDATREANQLTLTLAEVSVPFHPKIPVDVTRLDYLGRELEIWAAVPDAQKLKATADEIAATWSRLRADVVAHNGAKQADTFGALVAKASAAKSTAEYAAVTKPILDEVDNLENVYKK
jgi:hypothetical protein